MGIQMTPELFQTYKSYNSSADAAVFVAIVTNHKVTVMGYFNSDGVSSNQMRDILIASELLWDFVKSEAIALATHSAIQLVVVPEGKESLDDCTVRLECSAPAEEVSEDTR